MALPIGSVRFNTTSNAVCKHARACRAHARTHTRTYACRDIKVECDKAGIAPAAAAMRWMVQHSLLSGACGDKVIVGASRMSQVQ